MRQADASQEAQFKARVTRTVTGNLGRESKTSDSRHRKVANGQYVQVTLDTDTRCPTARGHLQVENQFLADEILLFYASEAANFSSSKSELRMSGCPEMDDC